MDDLNGSIDMPKVVSVEILLLGVTWRIYLRGVLLKKHFLTYDSAKAYIPTLHDYFGDECTFVLKESPDVFEKMVG